MRPERIDQREARLVCHLAFGQPLGVMIGVPTETYCAWFDSLPPALGAELAMALIQLFPGSLIKSPLVTDQITDGFTARIRRLGPTPLLVAGTALTLASLTDFIFLQRAPHGHWQDSQRLLDVLEEASEGTLFESAELDRFVEQSRLRHPLRERQWNKEREGWRVLREGELSSASVAEWLRQKLLAGLTP